VKAVRKKWKKKKQTNQNKMTLIKLTKIIDMDKTHQH
jgi:hypothetical protein